MSKVIELVKWKGSCRFPKVVTIKSSCMQLLFVLNKNLCVNNFSYFVQWWSFMHNTNMLFCKNWQSFFLLRPCNRVKCLLNLVVQVSYYRHTTIISLPKIPCKSLYSVLVLLYIRDPKCYIHFFMFLGSIMFELAKTFNQRLHNPPLSKWYLQFFLFLLNTRWISAR